MKFSKSGVWVKVKYCGFTLYNYDTDSTDKETAEDNSGGEDNQSESEQSEEEPSQPEITFTELTDEDYSEYANIPDGGIEDTETSEQEIVPSHHETADQEDADDSLADEEAEPLDEQNESVKESDRMKAADKKTERKNVKGATEDKDEKKSIKQRWEDIKPFIPVGKKGLKKLLKLIRLRELETYLKVGGDDPYAAGKNFARANQAFYPALALLCTAFSVSIKKTEIDCDYNKKGLDFSGSVTILARPSAIICLAIYLIVNYFIITHKQKVKPNNNSDNDIKEGNENE